MSYKTGYIVSRSLQEMGILPEPFIKIFLPKVDQYKNVMTSIGGVEEVAKDSKLWTLEGFEISDLYKAELVHIICIEAIEEQFSGEPEPGTYYKNGRYYFPLDVVQWDTVKRLLKFPELWITNPVNFIIKGNRTAHLVKPKTYTEAEFKAGLEAAFKAGRAHDDVYGFAEDEVEFHNPSFEIWYEINYPKEFDQLIIKF